MTLTIPRHRLSAWAFAEEYFEAKAVAVRLLAGIGLAQPPGQIQELSRRYGSMDMLLPTG